MKQINLGEILKKHLANYNDNGDAIPFIIEAMKEACYEALDIAAGQCYLLDSGDYHTDPISILSLKTRIK